MTTRENILDISLEGIPPSIQELNLDNVRRKLMEEEPEGKGWTLEQATEAELWYRRYLTLCLKYGQESIVPNYAIDMFWHQHILDTRAYAVDCQNVFGEFMHHFPYFGLNGDKGELECAFVKTNQLYRIEFGEDCTEMKSNYNVKRSELPNSCRVENCGNGCRQGCKRG